MAVLTPSMTARGTADQFMRSAETLRLAAEAADRMWTQMMASRTAYENRWGARSSVNPVVRIAWTEHDRQFGPRYGALARTLNAAGVIFRRAVDQLSNFEYDESTAQQLEAAIAQANRYLPAARSALRTWPSQPEALYDSGSAVSLDERIWRVVAPDDIVRRATGGIGTQAVMTTADRWEAGQLATKLEQEVTSGATDWRNILAVVGVLALAGAGAYFYFGARSFKQGMTERTYSAGQQAATAKRRAQRKRTGAPRRPRRRS